MDYGTERLVVHDGITVHKDFIAPTPGVVKLPIGKHRSQLVLHLRQLPIPRVAQESNITHLTSIKDLLAQHGNSVATCTDPQLNIEPMDFQPPFLVYDELVVYPTVKGTAARGGLLDVYMTGVVVIEFNCLGVEQRTSLILQINIPMFKSIQLHIDKECSKGKSRDEGVETTLDRIEEAILLEQERHPILVIVIVVVLCVLISFCFIFLCNLFLGKPWHQAIPLCGDCITSHFKANLAVSSHSSGPSLVLQPQHQLPVLVPVLIRYS